jgi:hypothetical protein
LLREFPNITNYICAYGDSNVSINAVVKAIYGYIKFMGKLPVTVNSDFKYGWGINK